MSGTTPGRLHVVTDETLQSRLSHLELAAIAAGAGADVVQFREKRAWSDDARKDTALAMRERLAGYPTRLVVNDRVDVALAAGADGVHLGPADEAPSVARRVLGPRAIVGATANDLDRACGVTAEPVDYIGVGPVFGTRSKRDPAPVLGLDGLRRIVEAVDRPVIAIGNITAERVERVLATGAYGVAVLSAVVCDADPASRVADLVRAVERALGTRVA